MDQALSDLLLFANLSHICIFLLAIGSEIGKSAGGGGLLEVVVDGWERTLLIVTDNLRQTASGTADDVLDDVPEVVDQKVERGSALGDGAEQAVDGADDVANQARHVVDEADQEGVEVQRVEDALDDLDEMAQAHDELQVDVHVGDRDVDLLDRDLHARVDLHETGDFGVQVDVGLELLDC